MQRRIFLKNSGLVLGALAFLSNKTMAQLMADPTWKINMLTDTIGIFFLDKAVDKFNKKTRFICGHAADGYDVIVKRDDLKLFGDYLGKVLIFVEAEIKSGKSKEEILKATSIPGVTEWKGDGIERPLTAAYVELSTK